MQESAAFIKPSDTKVTPKNFFKMINHTKRSFKFKLKFKASTRHSVLTNS